MASQATIQGIIDYYVNLLIVQYHNQPKAMATIALIIGELLVSDIAQDVEDGYAIDTYTAWQNGEEIEIDPGVGAQLDVMGKYAGVDRFYRELNLTDYFGFVDYGNPVPTDAFGFSTYSTYTGPSFNGVLTYSGFFSQNNQLFDSVFLQLIQYAVQLNVLNFSFQAIDALLYEFFGTTLRAEYGPSPMVMTFFIDITETPLMLAILYKHLLPIPMAVGAIVVTGITSEAFAFPSYSDISSGTISPFDGGFSTYANYATLPNQQTLSYNNMSAA
jgi:hypothetical protein